MCLLQCLRFAPFEITSVFVFEIVEKEMILWGRGEEEKNVSWIFWCFILWPAIQGFILNEPSAWVGKNVLASLGHSTSL